MPLRPTAQQHHWTIRLVGYGHLLELDEPPWLETRPNSAAGNVSPSHVTVLPFDVRHAYSHPTSRMVFCSSVPSNSPSPRNTTFVPSGISVRTSSTRAMWRSSGKCPLGHWRTRQTSGRARPLE